MDIYVHERRQYIVISVSGSAVSGIGPVTLNGNTGNAEVYAKAPSLLGAGTYSSTIIVRACMNDPNCNTGQLAGSPAQISVNYVVESASVGDVVAPGVVAANVPGEVIIRGRGLAGARSIAFGALPATTMTIINDREIRARYPALAAGDYPISVDAGAISFGATLMAVSPVAFAQGDLLFSTPGTITGAVVYNARYRSLFVLKRSSNVHSNQLFRYTYNAGSWSAATTVPINDPNDIALSFDHRTLFVAAGSTVTEVDPNNLTTLGSYQMPITSTSGYVSNLGALNNGYVVATTASNTCCPSTYLYSPAAHSFSEIGLTGQNQSSFGAGNYKSNRNGSIAIAEGTVAIGVYRTTADSVTFDRFSPSVDPYAANLLTIDPSGARFLMAHTMPTSGYEYWVRLYDSSTLQLRGSLPSSTLAAHIDVVNGRAYALDAANEIRTYDISTDMGAGFYPQIGTGIAVNDPGTVRGYSVSFYPSLDATPDGKTLFISGTTRTVIVPLP